MKIFSTQQKAGIIFVVFSAIATLWVVNLNYKQRQETNKKQKEEPQQEIVLQYFDPNTADSITLRRVGLNERVTRNILRYRQKGGKWKNTEHFKTVWGLDDSTFQALKPYIQIDTMPFYRARKERLIRDSLYWDSVKITYKQKRDSIFKSIDSTYQPTHEKRDTIIELNTADTNDLQYIRGIGKYTATQIIRYRNDLGGYAKVEQLIEIEKVKGLDSLLTYFVVEPDSIKKISVNHCSVNKLSKHPYLRFNQAKAIYEYRRKHIRIKSIEKLQDIKELSEDDIKRITPYLSFE